MCGLVGFWQKDALLEKTALNQITQDMAAKLSHRGPDSSGVWVDEKTGISLGHRRLAIVDLTMEGHQPMQSRSARFVLAYNGEIYNSQELRTELQAKGYQFRGGSDTEVLVEAIDCWGVLVTCQRIMGMFAFALWDRQEKNLYLVRDRLGIKPLYWGWQNKVLFFGSELKSFVPHPKWNPALNEQAVTSYLRFNYVPTPQSIFKGIEKLKPGTILKLKAGSEIPEEITFWSLKEKIQQRRFLQEPKQVVIETFEALLKDAVKRRMVADVPLGAFLSGGIDSSMIVALMQAQSDKPIKSFSIGFNETGFNEAEYAKKVAQHLKTEHHELYVSGHDALSVIPQLSQYYDEPFADVSQIPTFLVSQLARQQVIVALSGDGGDEVFAGYNRYAAINRLETSFKYLPYVFKIALKQLIHLGSASTWDKILAKPFQINQIGDKLYKFSSLLNTASREDAYKILVSFWELPETLIQAAGKAQELWNDTWKPSGLNLNGVEYFQYMDMLTYLPDDILTKVDRASMAVGLEVRVPFLDHRLVEWAWGLPLEYKLQAGKTKWIVRKLLSRYVPDNLSQRPKMGFGVPIGDWLRGPLQDWAQTLLSAPRLKAEGLLNPDLVQTRLQEHLSGQRNWQDSLWGLLMLQAWREQWKI